MHAGDPDAYMNDDFHEAPETNIERKLFNKLLLSITKELEQCELGSSGYHPQIDVLEVFCGPQSTDASVPTVGSQGNALWHG